MPNAVKSYLFPHTCLAIGCIFIMDKPKPLQGHCLHQGQGERVGESKHLTFGNKWICEQCATIFNSTYCFCSWGKQVRILRSFISSHYNIINSEHQNDGPFCPPAYHHFSSGKISLFIVTYVVSDISLSKSL